MQEEIKMVESAIRRVVEDVLSEFEITDREDFEAVKNAICRDLEELTWEDALAEED